MNITALTKIASNVTRLGGRPLLKFQKYSPEILTAVGVIGVGVGTVMVAKATLRLDNELDVANARINMSTNKTKAYAKNVLDLVKLYGPGVVVVIGGVVCIVSATGILKRRNVALVATVTGLQETLGRYRERVDGELGQEKERELFHGLTREEITGADGKKEIAMVFDPNSLSIYAKIFDEGNAEWEPNAEYNRLRIQAVQQWANDRLHAVGHVFLNEVYDDLGFQHTKAGAVVGWVLSTDGSTDNYIDFGLFETRSKRFINGDERSIILDFNVDGVILDKI